MKYFGSFNNFLFFEFKIIDKDFQEIISLKENKIIEAIIQIYSRRNLDVVKNLVLFMMYEQTRKGYPIINQIKLYKIMYPDFNKYIPEIEKYLLIL